MTGLVGGLFAGLGVFAAGTLIGTKAGTDDPVQFDVALFLSVFGALVMSYVGGKIGASVGE